MNIINKTATLAATAATSLALTATAANSVTIKNFDEDLATVYVNDEPTTNGQQVAVDGTVKIELGGFRNDYYFRYAPETQTDRELAFDCWEGVPSGYEGANPATFTVDGDLTITPNVNVKGYKWRLSDDRTAVENQYFRWNVTIPAKSTDRTVSLGVFIANLVGSTVPSLPLDCVQRVEVDGKNYTITGVSGPSTAPFFAENSYIDSIVLPWRFTTIGNYLAKGSNFVITNLVGLAEANVTSVGSFVFNSNTTTVFQGPVENFVPVHATSIGSEAYNGRSGMTGEMVLTDVTSIGQQAFRYCSGLTSMRITSPNLKSISDFTFWNCNALTDITLCASNLTYVGGNCIQGGEKRFTFIGGAPSWAIATKIVQYQTAVDGAHAASLRIDPTEPSWWDLTVPPTENEVAAGLPEGFLGVFVNNVGERKAWVVADGDAAGATLLETDMTRQDGNTGYVTHGGLKQGDALVLTAPEGLTKCELQHLRDGHWTTEEVKAGTTVSYTHGGELTRAVWGVDGVTLGVTTKGYKGTYSVEVVDGEELGPGIYSTGAKVRVTAIGSSEHPRSAISAWSGDVPAGQETNATIELTLEENTTVEALFRPLEWLYDPAKKTITDGEYTSKAGDGNTNVDYEYGMYFQGFTAADYTLWLDFSIPIYNPNDPEHDYWLAKVSGSSNNQNWRHVRFGTNITTVAGEMFYYSSTLEDVEGFGKTRVVNIPANFFRAIGLNKQTRDASEFVPETLTNINTYSYLDAPELTGTLRLRITNLDARGSIRVNGCTNFEFLAEGVTNAASFKTVVAPERVLFASTNLVSAAQGAFNKNLKDLVFCAHAPTAAALDNILYSVATTNATVHCSKYAPGWKAMRATGYSAMDEWTARPAGCWGIYQTADGKKRFYLIQKDSKYDVRKGMMVLVK